MMGQNARPKKQLTVWSSFWKNHQNLGLEPPFLLVVSETVYPSIMIRRDPYSIVSGGLERVLFSHLQVS